MSDDKAGCAACGDGVLARAGDWDESQHPRDDRGRFGSGGGGGDDKKPSGGKDHPGKGYSASAKLVGGVIHTNSVYDAQRALAENRKVELDQPRTLSVLINKLGDTAQKMIAAGKQAPVYNLCNVTVPGCNLFCAETKGIPRAEMPQLDDQQTKDFRKYLKAQGYKIEKGETPAANLRATQNELNGAKVAGVAEKLRAEPGHYSKRIIVSKDDYILDGHHHWGAKVGLDAEDGILDNDTPVRIARVDISITKLLEEAEKFTGGKGKKTVSESGTSKSLHGAGQIIADLYRATFDDEELEYWIEHFIKLRAERQRKWEAVRAEAERLVRGDYIQLPSGKLDGSHPGPGHGGGGGGDSGGGDKGGKESTGKANDYGLVKGDAEKYHALRAEWSALNNQMLDEDLVDHPDGLEATRLTFQMQALVKEMQTLKADPGGPGGIGLPGGPRDVAIVGAGPGGLWAGINAGAEGLDGLLIEGESRVGGQAKFSSRIENYGGYPVGVRGDRLMQDLHMQSQRLGTESLLGVRVTGMTFDESTGLKHLTLSNGDKVEARTVILAGGMFFRPLPPFPGSEGPGIVIGDNEKLQAAVKAVGPKGNVCVIGGSNGAGQAALAAAKHCNHVYVLARSPIENDMSPYVISGLRNHPKITVIERDQIAKLFRDEKGDPVSMVTQNGQTVPVNAIGAWVGSLPDTKWMGGTDIGLDKGNKVRTADTQEEKTAFKEKYGREPDRLETMIPGVYVAGDIRVGGAGRVGEAAGDGQHALRAANGVLYAQKKAFKDAQKKEKAAKAAKPKKVIKEKDTAALDKLIDELFDLDRLNPWWGQTVEGAGPLQPNKKESGLDMRIFEPVEELELYDGDRLVGVYVPGLRYNCWDDDVHVLLAKVLDQWLTEGKATIVEERGTQSASASGQGEIK